jgi:hypothetical protein
MHNILKHPVYKHTHTHKQISGLCANPLTVMTTDTADVFVTIRTLQLHVGKRGIATTKL